MLYYDPEFKVDYEMKRRLYGSLDRLVGDINEFNKTDAEIESFKSKSKFLMV